MSLSKRIHALPLQLANQIAAGEVIERPASVIKELVENSLDARSTAISIEVEGAGSQLISVHDNGFGIHPEDLHLAISRHATSKITSSADLAQIASLGFRGEALPSIQSVSQFSIASRQTDNDRGWQANGGDTQLTPLAMPYGTRVDVRDLFFNLPARRRFLRSPRTEQQHILTTLQRLALSHFDVAWQCRFNGQTKLQLPAATTDADKLKRLSKICGHSFTQQALPVYHAWDTTQLSGWIGGLDGHRPQTDVQYFFINGRVIRDRLMAHAIRQAFGDVIPEGRQPAYVLYLTLPLDHVDVNVHPTKHEVRFRDARLIHGFISRAILDTLQQTRTASPAHIVPQKQPVIKESPASYQTKPLIPAIQRPIASVPPVTDNSVSFEVLSIIEQRYALVLKSQAYWLIDLVSAEQNWQHQQLEKALLTDSLVARPILVPLRYDATEKQCHRLAQYHGLLAKYGILLIAHEQTVQLKQIPSVLIETDKQVFVAHLLKQVEQQVLTEDNLKQSLHKALPKISVFNQEKALQTLKKYASESEWPIDWARQLDSSTLSSLFSTP